MQVAGSPWSETPSNRLQIRDLALTAGAILTLHLGIMHRFPIIYGGDTVARLVNFPKILIGHQLPLLQILIYAVMRWFYGPVAIWVLMGCVAAIAGAGLYVLTGTVTQDRRAARIAAFLYVVNPFILFYSLVPYQEALLVAGVAWGAYFLLQPPTKRTLALASLFSGAACLARYEGWIAAAVMALAYFRRSQATGRAGRIKGLLAAVALFGWAPAAWMVWNRGLSPAGSYVFSPGFEWGRLHRIYFIAKSTLWWNESAVVCLAVLGLAAQAAGVRRRQGGYLHAILGYLALFALALIASGHGIEPDPVRLVTEREAFVPVALLLLFAGSGGALWLDVSKHILRPHRVERAATIVLFAVVGAYSLARGIRRVAEVNSDPTLKTDYETARFLAVERAPALILAPPLSQTEVATYLHNVERSSGEWGRREAERHLRLVEHTPLDYQRILMFSWLGRDTILSSDGLATLDCEAIRGVVAGQLEFIAVFGDFVPLREHEKCLLAAVVAGRAPVRVIHNGSREVKIYSPKRSR